MTKKLMGLLINLFSLPINIILKFFNYFVIYRSGSAIGDQLLISGTAKLIKNKYNYKIILFTRYSEFFWFNKNFHKVFRIYNISYVDRIILFLLKNLKGKRVKEFLSQKKDQNNKHFLYYYNNQQKNHIAQIHSQHFGLDLNFKDFKNEIYFSSKEIENFKKKLDLPKKYSVIQSTSKQTYTKNKEWKVEGMQSIVNNFQDINWIQVGKSEEPILSNCRQLFDLDLRELAYIISQCDFMISYEGLFNHISSCFDKKNFLIHTGFLPVEFAFYKNNILIENNKSINCYPCYNFDCKHHAKLVNEFLTEEFVIKKISSNI
jgi:ADP-heptose:LPS heptosyltransferase|tara:strand:- start:4475 stop:5428 length:954 start_codon:yes stop_codon:yes gene_type:complete